MCKTYTANSTPMTRSRVFAFVRGALEFRSAVGLTYGGSPWSSLSQAYDWGRECMHRLTRRRFES